MKQLILFAFFSLVGHLSFGQIDGQKEITPQMVQKINADVEKQIPSFKQRLTKQYLSIDQIEFSVDTFRIEKVASKRMDIDYSTMGMNVTVNEMTIAYDKLMNKYYNRLLKLLSVEDKKVLITAQKAWLVYRDSESKLISVMTKDEYSGGGTIQTNIATGAYLSLVVRRTIEIFNYYDSIIKDK